MSATALRSEAARTRTSVARSRTLRSDGDLTDPYRWLLNTLQEARRRAVFVAATVPAPAVDLLALHQRWMAQGTGPQWYWHSPGGLGFVSVGRAHTLEIKGEHPFQHLQSEMDASSGDMERALYPDALAAPEGLRFVGGFGFSARTPTSSPWRGFGAGAFCPPNVALRRSGHAGPDPYSCV